MGGPRGGGRVGAVLKMGVTDREQQEQCTGTHKREEQKVIYLPYKYSFQLRFQNEPFESAKRNCCL